MEQKFVLSCESTVDLPYEYVVKKDIHVIFYNFVFNGELYEDNMCRTEGYLETFYNWLKSGFNISTSQINRYQYVDYFRKLLDKGDLLHLCFSSGMSESYHNALSVLEELKEEYPDRKIEIVDSLAGSSGYGLLVECASDLRDEGKSIEEVRDWILENRLNIHHEFYSTNIMYFKKSGRISGAAALIGTLFNICPLMKLDRDGRIYAYSKVHGKRKAINHSVDNMIENAINGSEYDGKCFIAHSDCEEDAICLKTLIEENFHNLKDKVKILNIGTTIATHCGTGTVALFYLGNQRQ